MKVKYILATAALFAMSALAPVAADDGTAGKFTELRVREYREMLRLHENGMHSRSRIVFESMAKESAMTDPEGYAILSDVIMNIDMVGSDLDMGQGMCGSSSGSVPTNVGQPLIRVSQITVGGR